MDIRTVRQRTKQTVAELRLALQLLITVILSITVGLVIALLSFGPSRPFPFSECLEYQLNEAPSSCQPLAPILLLLAGCLLVATAFSLLRNRLRSNRK